MTIGTVEFDLASVLAEITDGKSAESLKFSNLVNIEYQATRNVGAYSALKTGVTCGNKIGFIDLGNSYDFLKSTDGLSSGCEYNEQDVKVTTSVKKWDTHNYNGEVVWCIKDLECAFKEYMGLPINADKTPENAFSAFLVTYFRDNLQRSHWTRVWFTDSSAATSSKLFGGDGLWLQTIAAANANNNVITITENASGTYAEQTALSASRGFDVFSAIHKKATKSRKLRGKKAQLKILTTEDLALNYLDYLRENNQVNCCFKSDVTQDVYNEMNLNIFGMPIEIVYEWDDIIQGGEFADLDDGTKFSSPHRALLTYANNIPFGVSSQSMLDDVELVYDPIKKNLHIRSEYDLGTAVIFDDELILAI